MDAHARREHLGDSGRSDEWGYIDSGLERPVDVFPSDLVGEVVAVHGDDQRASKFGEGGEDPSEEGTDEVVGVGVGGAAEPSVGVIEHQDRGEALVVDGGQHLVHDL